MAENSSKCRWFAIRTRSQCEKLATTVLRNKGYDPFLPLSRLERRWSDRIRRMDVPLFSGYVFCRFDVDFRLPILTMPSVVEIVGTGGTPAPIDDTEIAVIRTLVESGLSAQPRPFLEVGKRVGVVAGPLRGLEGILLHSSNGDRLVVSITMLRRSVAAEIDRRWVVPAAAWSRFRSDPSGQTLARYSSN